MTDEDPLSRVETVLADAGRRPLAERAELLERVHAQLVAELDALDVSAAASAGPADG